MNARDATAMSAQAWRRPVTHIPPEHHRMLGRQVAEQTITAQADAGMPPECIERVQEEIAAHALSEATTREGRAFAREYDDTARVLVRELQELEAGE